MPPYGHKAIKTEGAQPADSKLLAVSLPMAAPSFPLELDSRYHLSERLSLTTLSKTALHQHLWILHALLYFSA